MTRGGYIDTPLRAARNARLEGGDFYSIVVQISILETRLIILYATIGSHVEFARMLLKRGPVIDARNDGLTPLHWAARNGEKQVV